MNGERIWGVLQALFAIVGFIWVLTQLYSHWIVRRPRLVATIRYGLYATDPRHLTDVFRQTGSLVFQGKSEITERLRDWAERLIHQKDLLGNEPDLLFDITIRNHGHSTLQSVRLISSSFLASARLIRPEVPDEVLLDFASRDHQTIVVGTLGPGDKV